MDNLRRMQNPALCETVYLYHANAPRGVWENRCHIWLLCKCARFSQFLCQRNTRRHEISKSIRRRSLAIAKFRHRHAAMQIARCHIFFPCFEVIALFDALECFSIKASCHRVHRVFRNDIWPSNSIFRTHLRSTTLRKMCNLYPEVFKKQEIDAVGPLP